MAISTNSIIHYTDSLDKLKSIIQEGFKVKYCLEDLLLKDSSQKGGAFPMVCFCDIPFSDIKNHLDSYGYYGVGLSKNWASSKGLNPVIYIEKNSDIGNTLYKHISSFIFKEEKIEALDVIQVWDYFKICAYLKNYEGPLTKGSEIIQDYRFYNEREWRYVPSKEILKGISNVVGKEAYINDKAKYNSQLEGLRLEFNFEDISYVIVKKEEEISELTKHLRNIYGDKCSATNLEILMTKIITVNQIISDF